MTRSAYAALLLLAGACAATARPGAAPEGASPDPVPAPPPGLRGSVISPDADPLPAVLAVAGPLAIRVVYPGPDDRVAAGDSSFIFGSVGDGTAALRINGQAVPVWPNGAWLAWIAFPPDSVMRFDLEASRGPESTRLTHLVHRDRRFTPPPTPAWVDPESLRPAGRVWWPAGEPIRLTLRAAEGTEVRLLLPGGDLLRFAPDPAAAPVAEGLQAFDRDPGGFDRPLRADRYAAVLLPRRL
ncbi:MAG TPA: hypothetical protein VJ773_03235, partial [Gemmatimonadales bacterium]|nr:hypothetical protein [Gemmatimonadales bacterium]